MYGMKKYGKLFADELTYWLLEACFIQYQCHMSIYYKYAPYVTNILFLTFACNNAPIKSNWFTLALCFTESTKKCFKSLVEAVGYQVFPTNSLFCRSPLTTILNLRLSRLPSG